MRNVCTDHYGIMGEQQQKRGISLPWEGRQGLFLKEDRSKLNLKRCQIIQAREVYVEKGILD